MLYSFGLYRDLIQSILWPSAPPALAAGTTGMSMIVMLTCVSVPLTLFGPGLSSTPPVTKSATSTSSWNHGMSTIVVNLCECDSHWFGPGFISILPMTKSASGNRSSSHGDEHDSYVNLCIYDTFVLGRDSFQSRLWSRGQPALAGVTIGVSMIVMWTCVSVTLTR